MNLNFWGHRWTVYVEIVELPAHQNKRNQLESTKEGNFVYEMKCKQCGASLEAKDEPTLVNKAKAHFHKEHSTLPVTDEQIAKTVKEHAKKVA